MFFLFHSFHYFCLTLDVMDSLPAYVVRYMVFKCGVLEPRDILALALSSKKMYRKVLGSPGDLPGETNAVDSEYNIF